MVFFYLSFYIIKLLKFKSTLQMLHWIFFAEEEVEKTVCIVQSACINVHTMTGKDFIPPLPFPVREGKLIRARNELKQSDKHLNSNSPLRLCFIQVSKVWVTKFGLLLERKNTATEAQFCPPGYAKHHNLTPHTQITHESIVKWCSCTPTTGIWQLTELFLVL